MNNSRINPFCGVLYLNNPFSILRQFLVLILIMTCVSCETNDDLRPDRIAPVQITSPAQQVVDLSGYWEKNYERSDNFDNEFKIYVANIQRRIKELEDNRNRNSSYNPGNIVKASRETVIGLGKFTEEITRMPTLHIVQDKKDVRIDREDDFALQCKFFDKLYSSNRSIYGTENCSWERGQLFIQLILQNGLNIVYQITLAPDGKALNITTTITSREVSEPMTISNYYRRYTSPESNYSCVQTLSRNNVCKKK